jgi:hypothetical protein
MLDPWGYYYEGYCEFIEASLNTLINKQERLHSASMYALLFNVRHVIELGLKDILAQLGEIQNNDLLIFNHDLKQLMNTTHKFLQSYEPLSGSPWKSSWALIDKHANFFIEIDVNSFTFRYPLTKNNMPSMEHNFEVNLQAIVSMFHEIRASFIKITPILMADERNFLGSKKNA